MNDKSLLLLTTWFDFKVGDGGGEDDVSFSISVTPSLPFRFSQIQKKLLNKIKKWAILNRFQGCSYQFSFKLSLSLYTYVPQVLPPFDFFKCKTGDFEIA